MRRLEEVPMIERIYYQNGRRSAVVSRTVDGKRWEVWLLLWQPRKKENKRRRQFADRMTRAQAIARWWCTQ